MVGCVCVCVCVLDIPLGVSLEGGVVDCSPSWISMFVITPLCVDVCVCVYVYVEIDR